MLQLREVYALPLERHPSGEWIKLIRKLRWIGMDEEAQRLQRAVSTLPPDKEPPWWRTRLAPTKVRVQR
jgi:hypothetical protein